MNVNHKQTILNKLLFAKLDSALGHHAWEVGDCLMSVFNMGQVLFPLLFSIILYWVDIFRA